MTECYETKVGSHSVKCQKVQTSSSVNFRTDDEIQVPIYLPTYLCR